RGPFDVSDRNGLSSLYQGETINTSMRRSSILMPTSPTYKTKFVSPSKSSLLNPNSFDRCWDELFMICGGTGITPMLQLIRYHLAHIKSNKEPGQKQKRIHMHLLFGNRTIEDVIDGIRLEEYSLSSRGMLTISYVLSNPPEEWSGLHGQINPGIIQRWLSEVKTTTPTTPTSPVPQFGDIRKSHTLRGHGYNLPKLQTIISDEPPPIPAKPSFSPTLKRGDHLTAPNDQEYFSYQPYPHQTMTEEPTSMEKSTSRIDIPLISKKSRKPAPLDPSSLHLLSHTTQSISPTSYHPLYRQEDHEDDYEITRGSPTSNKNFAITNQSNFKIIVCGPPGMMIVVEQTLSEIGYSENDCILLL
ncbi:6642_t:CDS:2, partial [Funneliformis geosporum]